jgi:mono/diheme cytochrome c family protein
MRRAIALTTAGLLLVIGLWGSSGAVQAQSTQGKAIFDGNCAMCHGQDGKGNGPASSAFHPPPKDFHLPSFWQGNATKKITDTIENGYNQMPALNLSPSQIKEVINYMEQTFKPRS